MTEPRATILLLEDDEGIARLEALGLEQAGYCVVTAETADTGMLRIAEGAVDLILLEQRLKSEVSGLEFFRRVKTAGYDIPAILVTGMQEEALLVEALRAGVRDFVPKTENFFKHLEPIVARVLDQVRTERELTESRIVAREHEQERHELEREIAHRKRAEVALRDAEQYLRLVFESVKDFAIFTIDLHGCIVSWNPGAEQLFGYAEAEILGQSIAAIYTPEDRAGGVPEHEIAVAVATGGSMDERWHIRKNGTRFFASGAVNPIFDDASQLRGFTKIARDVTESKQAAIERIRLLAELQAERALLNTLLDNAPVGIGLFDEDLRYLRINPTLADMSGLPLDAHLGRTISEVLPHMSATISDALRHVLATGQSILSAEIRGETPRLPGQERYWLYNFYPVKTPDGTSLGAGAIATDIDDLKRMQQALRDDDERKDQFLAMLAHELRNPLAPISNAVQIMKVEGVGGRNSEWSLKVIEDQIRLMTRMVDDLLDVSRITRGKVALQKDQVELQAVVDLAVQASGPLLNDYGHDFQINLPETPIVVEVDPARMAQVFSNLLNNAAKYTNEGGVISLSAASTGHDVVIRVSDNGIGIPPHLLPKVFDMFTQADQALSRSRGGLGIGLTLVRSLVEMHNGRVTASSAGVGHGSEFVITLPIARSVG